LKILQVVPFFSPAYMFGGPVAVSYQLSRELARREHEVVVYSSDAKDLTTRLNIESPSMLDDIKVYYFKNISMKLVEGLKLFITPGLFSKVKNELKEFNIIHLHEYSTFQNIIVAHYANKYGIPYVLQAHGSLSSVGAHQKLKLIYNKFFGYKLLRNASKVIALSQTEAQQYRNAGVPDDKIIIIPNGIDLSEYAELPSKGIFKKNHGLDKKEKIILYLGRIHQTKGLDLLADTFQVVSKDISNVKLVIIGPDDGYLATFSKRISDLGIQEKVLLTGFVEKKEKLEALIDSNVFVTPSYDGFPVTFLEACLTGCPIVTTSNELEWINENVGFVTSPNTSDLSRAIYKIISDDELHDFFSKKCREIVELKFSLDIVVSKLEQVYREVVEE